MSNLPKTALLRSTSPRPPRETNSEHAWKDERKAWSGPVSRILSSLPSEDHSSVTRVTAVIEQPTRKLLAETGGSIASLFGLAPQGVCCAVATHVGRGALLPHRFTLTAGRLRSRVGGLFSVALSVASRRLVVNQPAAWFEFGL